ncbi:MAG: hypothetical protein CSA76_04635 [Spirochaetales bacterium]|nr:MAG: hypothetical protein CSA76_04635 [Spirochaetales bacterium]
MLGKRLRSAKDGRLNKREVLVKQSIRQILESQTPEGAIIAGPTFSQYQYSWFRDGAFTAYAMMQNEKMREAEKFINWCSRIVLNSKEKIIQLKMKLTAGEKTDMYDFLGARYKASGAEDDSDWPNFQIDGYGSWLWCLSEYAFKSGWKKLPEEWKNSALITVNYLQMVWQLPNSDCWEEFPDRIHPSTLACVYGGLVSINRWLKKKSISTLAEKVRSFVYDNLNAGGYFPKFLGSDLVDASLLWLAVPFGLADVDDPVMMKTVALIEENLLEKGGVKRYAEDTYYGGGQWIIHSCWLAWYYYLVGRRKEAGSLMNWVIRQQKEDGSLPEQMTEITNEPSMVKTWEERWGTVATPLTWSHAMFLIVDQVGQLYTAK